MEYCISTLTRVIGPRQPYGAELVYPTAPFSLGSSDSTSELRDRHGAWTWFEYGSTDGFHPGLAGGLVSIEPVLKFSGLFDGIVGFSEGAAAANVLASLLEENRKHAFAQLEGEGEISYASCFATFDRPPLKFVVSISGYAVSHPAFRAFYDPFIWTPILHSLRKLDSVVDEIASMRFVESC
ncbi:Serine hydrolase FSH [Penicillium sp. IBT 31633x]|nr:Serine hydrolase FSH [Penicillium sp. IBT 31633x]